MKIINSERYQTKGGIIVELSSTLVEYNSAMIFLQDQLDSARGILLSSSFEFPGRYSCRDIGFKDPPIAITCRQKNMQIEALNLRGKVLLPEIYWSINNNIVVSKFSYDESKIDLEIKDHETGYSEELRSRQPSVFSIIRSIVDLFRNDQYPTLGLYGAFGYDLAFQFEKINLFQNRNINSRDMVLYLPDQIFIADNTTNKCYCHNYDFTCQGWERNGVVVNTNGLLRTGERYSFFPSLDKNLKCGDHLPGEFAKIVLKAKEFFKRGDLFEVVPGQVFFEICKDKPSKVFQRLKVNNPAPYGVLMNLGENEYLVGASPEMYVRVLGKQIESCPISGTIKRGRDAIEDARMIKKLLNSKKDEAELSMCADVDRNDKARVCIAGSVKVVGRRQIEMYSNLIHTVDHIKGELKEEFDAIDGFLAHAWCVTVTGAPKKAAMQFIEENEKSPRLWYGGAIGAIGFDGNIDTGIILRTIRIKEGLAEVRTGSTLLFDSDPKAEEAETHLKASVFLSVLTGLQKKKETELPIIQIHHQKKEKNQISTLNALVIDHQDSFVHNLANYFRVFGVVLQTLRPELAREYIIHKENTQALDLIILSPGPGRPEDFKLKETIDICIKNGVPIFGVCLGLQGIVEYFGGELGILHYPMHGKSSKLIHKNTWLFKGVKQNFIVGRYHSLFATSVPNCLQVTAYTIDNVVMAIEHLELPIWAVQFHPESILSLENEVGYKIIFNVVSRIHELKKHG